MKQANNTCDTCPLRDGCIERRGICRDYILYQERVEEVRKKIEQLNTSHKKAAGRSGSNKGSVQETGDLQQLEAHESGRASVPVQAKAGTDPKEDAETEAEKEADQRIQT